MCYVNIIKQDSIEKQRVAQYIRIITRCFDMTSEGASLSFVTFTVDFFEKSACICKVLLGIHMAWQLDMKYFYCLRSLNPRLRYRLQDHLKRSRQARNLSGPTKHVSWSYQPAALATGAAISCKTCRPWCRTASQIPSWPARGRCLRSTRWLRWRTVKSVCYLKGGRGRMFSCGRPTLPGDPVLSLR